MAVQYDKNTDYKALMDQAVAAGDYVSAAKYEQQRNAKIQDMNRAGGGTNPYGATVSTDYAQYLGGGYSPTGSYNDAGMNAADLAKINDYKSQYYTAMSLNDQAGMDAAHAAAEAIRAAYGYSGGKDGSENIGGVETAQNIAGLMRWMQSTQPSYQSQYNTQIDQMLNKILNREAFSYDVASDPLYQQYQTQYQREGNRAMNDTLASVASGAGGMNSYAVTAAQQANDYYNAQMADKIPELYQLAYEMYLQDIDNQVRDLGLLQQMDDIQYSRYRDTMSDWRNDLNFAYGAYRDSVGDEQWQKSFDYNASQDSKADAQARITEYIMAGGAVSELDPAIVASSGYTQAELDTMKNYAPTLSLGEESGTGLTEDTNNSTPTEYKPILEWEEVLEEIKKGNLTVGVLRDYKHYMQEPYKSGENLTPFGDISSYGPNFEKEWSKAMNMLYVLHESDEAVLKYLDELDPNEVTDAGISAIMWLLDLRGCRTRNKGEQ